MGFKYNVNLYRGMEINKDLLVTFHVNYEPPGSQFATYTEKPNSVTFKVSFALTISEGYQKSRLFLPGTCWFPFVSLLTKTVKLIQENIYSIFPAIGKIDWDAVDRRELERFQTEKCMYLNGYSMIPVVYMNAFNECFPGIKITTKDNQYIQIPLEDAIIISEMLNKIDPNTLSIAYLKLALK